ncbi:Helix-destabilizing protein [Anaerohalosphaera lusitana]|uniref:Single-stranded DNA-binding protein n=1 Tax=Anaerohalosphaera lusitana TaxID=1936003 RepID=A0A1U9NHE5_9BACT|nr:single-stranded DNA-binding protein [Anaerohalosphaera lusitana]AQT67329.1 Helix-destabilizing protein [Anaerohalosphaera lusitana]
MASYNKVILMGNLTRDPQLSYLPSQTPVCEFSIATNRRFKRQDGSQGEEACFTDCQIFGKRAEVINKYFQKGSPIFVEGRLKLDTWQAQDGSKRSRLRVFVENFEFVGGGSGGGGSRGGNQSQGQPQQYNNNQQFNQGPQDTGEPFNPMDDDIPF